MSQAQIIILVILLFFSGFFSGVETALMSLNRVKVDALFESGRKGSEALKRIKQNPHKLIITILIGNNIVNIGAASLATVVFTDIFGSSGVGIATGIMTFLILVFGEITPKTFAAQNAEKISLKVARPLEILSKILTPLVWVFEMISRLMSKMLGSKEGEDLSEQELRTIVTLGRDEGILSKDAAEIMHNVLEFEGTKVTNIMTPKVDMSTIDGNKKIRDVIDYVVRSKYSKFPVYTGNPDKIVGILHVDDILRYMHDKKMDVQIKNIVRNPFFVPEAKEIDDLLTEFEGKHLPMAIVVDEYGYVVGMVTVEDILEEIVGDIFDKSKKKSHYIKKVNEKTLRADARVPIDEVNKLLHLDIKSRYFNTLAGFIEHKLKRIPKEGETIKMKRVVLEVERVTKKEIKTVKIRRR